MNHELVFDCKDLPAWIIPEVTEFRCFMQHPNYGRGCDVPSAKVHIENGEYYIVQDYVQGISCANKLGYKYSFAIRCPGNERVSGLVKNIERRKLLNHES